MTGFKPFDHYKINSSWEAIRIANTLRTGLLIKELDVDYLQAHVQLTDCLIHNPCHVLLLSGLAEFNCIKLETGARKPKALSLIDGPLSLSGIWPWQENETALLNAGIPVSISNDAGSYVCESTYWSALNFRRQSGFPHYIAFFHLPVLSPRWNEYLLAKALLLSLDVVSDNKTF